MTRARLQVGYRASTEGTKKLILALGLSHPVEMAIPAGISVKVSFLRAEAELEPTGSRSQLWRPPGQVLADQLVDSEHRRRTGGG